MSESQKNPNNPDEQNSGWNKQTPFGEPMWLDVLKSIWAGLVMLFFTVIIGGALAVAIIAPWGRASHDCSIYCVIRQYFNAWWESKPASSAAPLRFHLHASNQYNRKAPRITPGGSVILADANSRQVASPSGLSDIR